MITRSQRKTLEFIKSFLQQNEYSPTTSEIAKGIGIKSRGVVYRYLKALAEEGFIRLIPKRHRNIELLSKPSSTGNHDVGCLPLVGAIAAGRPIEAIPQQESVDVASIFLGPKRYALRVKGDSMIEEGIFDGDIVVCESTDHARNGQIVVALVDNEEATLKHYYQNQDNTVTLRPANERLQPMTFSRNRVEVQGIYVGLLRIKD